MKKIWLSIIFVFISYACYGAVIETDSFIYSNTVVIASNLTVNGGLIINGNTTNLGTMVVNEATQTNQVPNLSQVIKATNGIDATFLANAGAVTSLLSQISTITITNPTLTITSSSNSWYWVPSLTNVTCSVFFNPAPIGWSGCGMLFLVQTNCTIIWPTNIAWYSSGTRITNAPSLSLFNRIVIESFNEVVTLGLISTNSTVVP